MLQPVASAGCELLSAASRWSSSSSGCDVTANDEPVADRNRARAARGIAGGGALEREVEHAREAAVAHERRELDAVCERHLAEDLEAVHSGGARSALDLRNPEPEEAGVDVPGCVD